jgi:Uma2 family endonuclease
MAVEPLQPNGLVSEQEFLSLPESMEHLELLDGEIILSPSPTPRHQLVLGRLFRALAAWADQHPPTFVGLSPLDVRLSPGRIVQPDLFVLREGWSGAEGPIDRVPDLMIEVLSQRRGYDRITKRLVYAEAGVREYWILDPLQRALEVCVGIETVAYQGPTLEREILPGLVIELEALWR